MAVETDRGNVVQAVPKVIFMLLLKGLGWPKPPNLEAIFHLILSHAHRDCSLASVASPNFALLKTPHRVGRMAKIAKKTAVSFSVLAAADLLKRAH